MKIGKYDFGILAIVYAALFVVLAVVDFSMWRARRDRLTEAWYRKSIVQGMVADSGESIDAAVESCKAFIARQPTHIPARLYLAQIYFKQGKYADAESAWDEIVKSDAAKPEEKAWALVGTGVSLF